MKNTVCIIIAAVLAAMSPFIHAQSGAQQSLAQSLGVQVFPATGQDAAKQSEDEAACYQWAVDNTGSDPFQIQQQQSQNAQQAAAAQQEAAGAGRGSGARGAVRGAAAGAVIGEIADDDAGKGAAYGAAVGVVAGRHRGRQAEQQAQQQVQQQSAEQAQVTEAQLDAFRNGFSACLEGKQYIAKF
jgi:hypothetical protein